MNTEEIIKQVAQAIEREGNTTAVFGTPVKLENKTVIPVAAVRLGGGGGGGGPGAALAEKIGKSIFSVAGAGGFDVRPVGFIHERDGQVVYTPIHLDVRNKPFLTEAALGLGRVIDTVSAVGLGFLQRKAPGVH